MGRVAVVHDSAEFGRRGVVRAGLDVMEHGQASGSLLHRGEFFICEPRGASLQIVTVEEAADSCFG